MSETSTLPEPTPVGNRFAKAHYVLLYFLGGALVIWLLSGFYQVQADQVAIVERLGQFLTMPNGKAQTIQHGLHYHLPWPIDRVHVISTQQRMTLNVKAFNASPAEYEDFKREYMNNPDNPFAGNKQAMDAIFNPYLIAADKSVVQMEMSVVFKIRDPEQWLQAVSHEYHTTYDPNAKNDLRNALLQQIAQRAMIAQTARLNFEDLLLEKRDTVPSSLQTLVIQGLVVHTTDAVNPKKPAEIDFGVDIQSVQVTALRPPAAIQPFYDRVLQERVGRDAEKAKAEAVANGLINQAKGERQTLTVDAEAYKNSVTQLAKGESQRFEQVLKQYLNAPDVVRYSLYVDAVTTVAGNARRIMFVQPGEKVIYFIDPAEYDPNQVRSAATRPGG